MKKLVLIDSNAIVHRAYHAIPKTFKSRRGEQTNAIYGFTTTLIKVLEDLRPDYVAASFDVAKKTFRHQEFAQYKATRVAADQELYDQIPRVKELLSVLNIPIFELEGFEADDCIGTIIEKCQTLDIEIYVITGDKDLFQLLNGKIFVYWLKHGLSESKIVGKKEIKEIFDLEPEDFVDLKALAGDSSDNIPGVPGIGPKTATELIQKFDNLKNIYDQIEKIGNVEIKERIKKLLLENKDQAFLSQKLATIRRDVPIGFDIEDCKFGGYDKEKLKNLFEELGFHSLLKRFGVEKSDEPKTKQAKEQKEKDEQLKLL